MAGAISMNMTGDKRLQRLLYQARTVEVRGAAASAASKAWRPVAKTMKANAKNVTETKTVWRSIGFRVKTYRNSGNTVVIVGPRRQKAANVEVDTDDFQQDVLGFYDTREEYRDPVKYVHLIEDGTQPHKIYSKTLSGRRIEINHPGTPAQPFMRKSFDAHKHTAKSKAGREFMNQLARRLEKRYGKRR